MQVVKDKLQNMSALRKAKAEAKAQEKLLHYKAEKDIAKARMEIAHEVRRAKEAEAAMELHVAKAGERAEKEFSKHSQNAPMFGAPNDLNIDGSNLHGSNIDDSNLPGSNMHSSNINGSNLHGMNMHGSNFDDSNVHGLNLHSSNIDRSNLHSSNIDDSNVHGANMHGQQHDLHTRK